MVCCYNNLRNSRDGAPAGIEHRQAAPTSYKSTASTSYSISNSPTDPTPQLPVLTTACPRTPIMATIQSAHPSTMGNSLPDEVITCLQNARFVSTSYITALFVSQRAPLNMFASILHLTCSPKSYCTMNWFHTIHGNLCSIEIMYYLQCLWLKLLLKN